MIRNWLEIVGFKMLVICIASLIFFGLNLYINSGDNPFGSSDFISTHFLEMIIFLTILTFFISLIVAGIKGLWITTSVFFIIVSVLFLLIPLILQGYPKIVTTILILTFNVIIISLLTIGKTYLVVPVIFGVITTLCVTAFLTSYIGNMLENIGLSYTDNVLFEIQEMEMSSIITVGILISTFGFSFMIAKNTMIEYLAIGSKLKNKSFVKKFRFGILKGRIQIQNYLLPLTFCFIGLTFTKLLFLFTRSTGYSIYLGEMVLVEIVRLVPIILGTLLTLPIVSLIAGFMD